MKKKTIILLSFILAAAVLIGCKAEETEKYTDLTSLYDTLIKNPDMPEMIQLSEKRMYSLFGTDVSSYPQAIAAVCGDSLRVDEIWLIQAETKEDAANFAKLAKARIDQKYSENENYLPEQAVIAKEGKIIQKGSYLAMFVSPDADGMEKTFNEAFNG